MKPKLTVTSDFTDDFNAIIKRFKNDTVLVGIPAETASRKEDAEAGPINNATILAINEFGSPANNIPARPVLQNGIRKAQDEIADEFKRGAINALTEGESALPTAYNRVGIIASNSVKKGINAQDFEGGGPDNEGPAASTIAARRARGFKGTKSLIVTGQMRNSITYVVKGKGE